jgi:hypothetical protein
MKELADIPEMCADQDFADGLILRDQLGSIANHVAGVVHSRAQSL